MLNTCLFLSLPVQPPLFMLGAHAFDASRSLFDARPGSGHDAVAYGAKPRFGLVTVVRPTIA